MRSLLILPLLLPVSALADCPAVPDRSDRHIELMELLADAPDERAAADYSDELWGIWSTAPDEIAQEILDRGMQWRNSYNLVSALKDFDTLINYCPHYAEGYNQRAFVHFIREDYEAALADLDKVLELVPDHIGAISGQAFALIRWGKDREGQIALRRALLLNPWLPERHLITPLPENEENGTEIDL